MTDFWEQQATPAPSRVAVGDQTVMRGSLVRLCPHPGRDIFDLALADRLAVVESIQEDSDGKLHVAVTLEDDPGRDLGAMRALGHRFFFGLDEIEPVPEGFQPERRPSRILVAGIGNIFLGDDAFGVEVAKRLADVALPEEVEVREFGIRGMDLAYALQDDYETVIFVDAAPRGEAPGTVSVIEPDLELGEVVLDTHAMDPLRVVALARELGRIPDRIVVVACEPAVVVRGEHDEELVGELSEPVAAAVGRAVELIAVLTRKIVETDGKVVQS